MPKATNPVTFAAYFNVSSTLLARLGVLNPTLAIETKLFLDPLLIPNSSHSEIRNDATKQYRAHFETIIKLLQKSKRRGDVPWRNAKRGFQFHEVRGTCLGYGAASISGSGFGDKLIDRVMGTAKEIVDLGVNDPDLFVVLALFENDIGPDRISDMTTQVVIKALLRFNNRVLSQLPVSRTRFNIFGHATDLPVNPFQAQKTPVILLPTDVLNDLPIATDWDSAKDAAAHNSSLRNRVNLHIGQIWEAKSKRDKQELRQQALSSTQAFKTLLDVVHGVQLTPYDVSADPLGLIKWAEIGERYAANHPVQLNPPTDIASAFKVVQEIVQNFRFLIENQGLAKSLYSNGKPLKEAYSQRLFFAVGHSYCRANNLDISAEIDVGTGKVDFKISRGFEARIVVELKLSTNPKLVDGYTKQLATYKAATIGARAIYVVIDVGRKGKKLQDLYTAQNKAKLGSTSTIEYIDAVPKKPASKR